MHLTPTFHMNKPTILGLALIGLLATSCGSGDTATSTARTETVDEDQSAKLAESAKARVLASLRPKLDSLPATDKAAADAITASLDTWYGSELAPAVKMAPDVENAFQISALLLEKRATENKRMADNKFLTAAARSKFQGKYDKVVAESTANLKELTDLAAAPKGLPEAAQQTLVSSVRAKQGASGRIMSAISRDAQREISEASSRAVRRQFGGY